MAHIELCAYCGADSNFLVWWSSERVEGCLGYAAKRRVDGGNPVPLTGYVPFSNGGKVTANAAGQPSTKWPFQRFTWSDFEHNQGKVEYQVVAMVGTPASPVESPTLVSDWIEPKAPEFGDIVPYFNFGTVSSRWFAKFADLYPNEFETLRQALAQIDSLERPKATWRSQRC